MGGVDQEELNYTSGFLRLGTNYWPSINACIVCRSRIRHPHLVLNGSSSRRESVEAKRASRDAHYSSVLRVELIEETPRQASSLFFFREGLMNKSLYGLAGLGQVNRRLNFIRDKRDTNVTVL